MFLQDHLLHKNIGNTSNFSQKLHLNIVKLIIVFRFKRVKYYHHLAGDVHECNVCT